MASEFDRYAKTYDADLKEAMPRGMEENEYFARYKAEFVERAMTGERVGTLLDFGCGAGRSLVHLAASFPQAQMSGYDPSVESARIAQEQFPAARVTSEWADVPPSAFDLVFAANVFHHIDTAAIPAWLRRCRDALAPGGSLFVFEHNPLNPLTRYVFERCAFDKDAEMIPRGTLMRLANEAALDVVDAKYTLFFPKPLGMLRPLERFLHWLPLGAQYCLRLKKP
jgi:cyclopropane fatty-acyl-phospholipid synthase-like methyltransferase